MVHKRTRPTTDDERRSLSRNVPWFSFGLTFRRDVRFQGVNFVAGSHVHARFIFDSYRATYRYGLLRSERLDLDVGGTARAGGRGR